MEIRFCEDLGPWAWSVFEGPEERQRGEFVDHITKGCIWPEWQREFALPKPPPRPLLAFLAVPSAIVHIKGSSCQGPPLDVASQETSDDLTPALSFPVADTSNIVWIAMRHAILGAGYRIEFSCYCAVIISLLGFGYFTRIWITGIFYMLLTFIEQLVSF